MNILIGDLMQGISEWLSHKPNQWVLAFLSGGLAFRGLVAAYLPPGFDEAYYYLYTLHLNWSYFDHPPLVALTTGFGPWLTGAVSPFTIRLGPLLLYAGTLIFLYLTSLKLFTQRAALLTLAIATLIPIFQVGFGVLTLPDSPLMFFWSACLYWAACEFFDQQERDQPTDQYCSVKKNYRLKQVGEEEKSKSLQYQPTYRLAIVGGLVGLACLGKYHGFVLGLGLVCFCLLSDRHRRALISPWTALGCGLFVAILSPVLLWNAQHGWISFAYQSSRAASTEEYQLTQVLTTWLVGVACLFPSFGLPIWWVIVSTSKTAIAKFFAAKSMASQLWSKGLLILCVSLPLILGLTYVSGYQPVLPTWQMPGFWGITLLLGYQAAKWQQCAPRAVWRWLAGSGLTVILILLVALVHISAGSLQKPSTNAWFGGFLPIETDPSTQTIDIRQLRQGFIESPELSQALRNADFIFTNQIFLAGQVAMALTPLASIPITCFSEDLRGFAFWSEPDAWLGKDGLYITSERFEDEANNLGIYREYFQSISPIGEISLQRGGETVEVFKVFRARTLLKPYPRPYGF